MKKHETIDTFISELKVCNETELPLKKSEIISELSNFGKEAEKESAKMISLATKPMLESENTWSFKFNEPMPLFTLSFAASPDMEKYKIDTTESGIDIYAIGTPEFKDSTIEVYDPAVVSTIDFMEKHFGPYEFGDDLNFIEIPGFGGGMEHTTVIYMGDAFVSRPVYRDVGKMVTVHEVVHHWIGDSQRFADWQDFWLIEGATEWITKLNLSEGVVSEAYSKQYKNVTSGPVHSPKSLILKM